MIVECKFCDSVYKAQNKAEENICKFCGTTIQKTESDQDKYIDQVHGMIPEKRVIPFPESQSPNINNLEASTNDSKNGLGTLLMSPAILFALILSLISFAHSGNTIESGLGIIGVIAALFIFPVAYALAPFYVGLSKGDWFPLLIAFAPMILLMFIKPLSDFMNKKFIIKNSFIKTSKDTALYIIVSLVLLHLFALIYALASYFFGIIAIKMEFKTVLLIFILNVGTLAVASYSATIFSGYFFTKANHKMGPYFMVSLYFVLYLYQFVFSPYNEDTSLTALATKFLCLVSIFLGSFFAYSSQFRLGEDELNTQMVAHEAKLLRELEELAILAAKQEEIKTDAALMMLIIFLNSEEKGLTRKKLDLIMKQNEVIYGKALPEYDSILNFFVENKVLTKNQKLYSKGINFIPYVQELSSSNPKCPKCFSTMVLRVANKDTDKSYNYWDCVKYPKCSGTINFISDWVSAVKILEDCYNENSFNLIDELQVGSMRFIQSSIVEEKWKKLINASDNVFQNIRNEIRGKNEPGKYIAPVDDLNEISLKELELACPNIQFPRGSCFLGKLRGDSRTHVTDFYLKEGGLRKTPLNEIIISEHVNGFIEAFFLAYQLSQENMMRDGQRVFNMTLIFHKVHMLKILAEQGENYLKKHTFTELNHPWGISVLKTLDSFGGFSFIVSCLAIDYKKNIVSKTICIKDRKIVAMFDKTILMIDKR